MTYTDVLLTLVTVMGAAGVILGTVLYGHSLAAQKSEQAWKSVAEAREEALKDVGKRLLLADQRAETLKAEIVRLEQRPDLTEAMRILNETLALVSEMKGAVDEIAERWS